MNQIKAVVGDVNDIRRFGLGGTVSLAAASAKAFVWSRTRVAGQPAELAASIEDAEAGVVAVNLGAPAGWLSSASPGGYNLEIQITWGDGSVLTWPAGEPVWLTVRSEGDPPPVI